MKVPETREMDLASPVWSWPAALRACPGQNAEAGRAFLGALVDSRP